LQRVVNKFVRLIFNLDYRSSVKEVMLKKFLLTIGQLMQLETTFFMVRYIKSPRHMLFQTYYKKI